MAAGAITGNRENLSIMRSLTAFAAALAAFAIAGCESTGGPPQPASVEESVEATATVEQLDLLKRTVVLKTEDGRLLTILAGPEVRNLAQLDIGDTVKAIYIQGVAARMAAPGQTGETDVAAGMVRAAEGDKPGVAVGEAVRTVVTIVSYDSRSKLVTFTGADGLVRSVVVAKPEMQEFARGLKPGDEVEVTFTEAFAICIVEAGAN